MRQDLGSYVPELRGNKLLMCCACARFLPQEDFSLEHIIPKQALDDDPSEVRLKFTANARGVNTLLCTKPLKIKGRTVYDNGCNSWKGRFYDRPIREVLSGRILTDRHRSYADQHTIAIMCAAYLAMVVRFGYQVALTPTGLLMRQQFFLPNKFNPDMPIRTQMLLMATPLDYSKAGPAFWTNPFSFSIDRGFCVIAVRGVSLALPLSRDPNTPIAKQIAIPPARYALRPDFRTVFE
jgi:hypothetical protein